jgi:hypothetical protein
MPFDNGAYVPPSKADLDADTDQAIRDWAAASPEDLEAAGINPLEVNGITAILCRLFPEVPAVTLGRILAAAAMAACSIAEAAEQAGGTFTPAGLSVRLGLAGAQLATAGREMAGMEGTDDPR